MVYLSDVTNNTKLSLYLLILCENVYSQHHILQYSFLSIINIKNVEKTVWYLIKVHSHMLNLIINFILLPFSCVLTFQSIEIYLLQIFLYRNIRLIKINNDKSHTNIYERNLFFLFTLVWLLICGMNILLFTTEILLQKYSKLLTEKHKIENHVDQIWNFLSDATK